MLKKLHKGDTTSIHIESNEGERALLCSNESSMRSPSLDLENDTVKFTEIELVLKSLISTIIENEINSYLNNLYGEIE